MRRRWRLRRHWPPGAVPAMITDTCSKNDTGGTTGVPGARRDAAGPSPRPPPAGPDTNRQSSSDPTAAHRPNAPGGTMDPTDTDPRHLRLPGRPGPVAGRTVGSAPRAIPPGHHLPAHRRGPGPGRGQRHHGLRRRLPVGPPLQPPGARVPVHVLQGPRRRTVLGEGDGLARPHVPHLGNVRRHHEAHLHHRRLHRPGPRPDHRGQVGRHGGGAVPRPGPPGRGRGMVQGGVPPDRPGLPHPGQAARRHDPGVAGPLAGRLGRVPRHPLRRPGLPDEPGAARPIPILGGGESEPAIRRATTLCDGWINTGAVLPDGPWPRWAGSTMP